VRRLIESGFSEEQVEVEAVTDAIKEAQDSHDIATRHDLRELELLGGVMALLLKTFFPS
jgi:hypothetical protein